MTANRSLKLEEVQSILGDLPKADLPAALFPVRLETRFKTEGNTTFLCVRIFPDDFHIDTHEPELTEDEERWGKQLWEQVWQSGRDAAMERALQDELAQRFGPGRAAWVAKTLKPLNPQDRSDQPGDLPVKPMYPAVERRESSWTRAPQVNAMPDRWVLIGYRQQQRALLAVGEPIRDQLAAGPDPDAPPPDLWSNHQFADYVAEQVRQHDLVLIPNLPNDTDSAQNIGHVVEALDRSGSNWDYLLPDPLSPNAPVRQAYLWDSGQVRLDAPIEAPGTPPRFIYDETRRPLLPAVFDASVMSAVEDSVILLDEGMRWMVDFDEAVRVGMGLRIPLPSEQEAKRGYDRLIVLGLKASPGGEDPVQTLTSLLESQRYTDSLDFVPQATPSNNTGEAPSGYTETEPEQETEFLSDRQESSSTPDCNCHIAAKAFGISPAAFGQLPHALDREQTYAQAMNTVLWPATWGYFLRYILNHVNGHLNDATIEALRQHFRKFVWARGPIPILRVGHQPYGILPVTSLDLYQSNGTAQQGLFGPKGVAILKQLRDRWQESLAHIPRATLKSTVEEMDTTLSNILGMQPVSEHLLGRMAFDGAFYGMPDPEGLPTDEDHEIFHRHENAMIEFNRLDENLNLPDFSIPGASLAFTEPIFKMTPKVTGADADRDSHAIVLKAIKDATFAELREGLSSGSGVEEGDKTPFYRLLRHSMLLAYVDTAYNIQRSLGLLQPDDHGDPALVDIISESGTTQTMLGLLKKKLQSALNLNLPDFGDVPLEDVIHTFATSVHPSAQIIEEMKESLELLATLPASELDLLLRETLDLSSHRLDAWITSIATARLDSLRQTRPQGLTLGGYGWVENLNMNDDRDAVTQVSTPEYERRSPLYERASNGGYVTAPSLPQAATAAILRSGYLNHGSQNATDPFAIDLSSERVRLAKWLLDGVRQGQNLGALLGYRFERGLQEQGLAKYILPFREVVPFGEVHRQNMSESEFVSHYRTSHLSPESLDKRAIEVIEAQHVVDGLELKRLWQDNLIPFGSGEGQITINLEDQAQVHEQLNRLLATVDAVSDLVTAESLYQLAQGNDLRAGGTLDAIAKGETPPPDPEVVRTPRSGVAHTHRVSAIFSGDIEPFETWRTDSFQQRAVLEPGLNHWLAQLLGDARRIRIKFAYWDPKTDTLIRENPARNLTSFLVSPLDVIYLASTNETGMGSALEAVMTYRVMRSRPPDIPAGATLRFFYDREANWKADRTIGFGTLNELARAARELVTNARPLDARDLASPENETAKNFDADELNQRARGIVGYYKGARTHLANAITHAQAEDFNLDTLRVALFRFFYAGSNEAVPLSAKDDEPSAKAILLEQAHNIAAEADRRIDALDQLEDSIDRRTASDAEKIEVDTKRIKIIFGEDFPVLPKFTPVNSDTLAQTFGASLSLQNQDPLAAMTWLGQVAPVRDGCNRLQTSLNYAEALYPDFSMDCTVGQLPYQAGDRWVALPTDSEPHITDARTSLMTLFPNGVNLNTPLSGLMVDEWVETIPNAQEMAAAAFHFDAPQAQTPHAILLAVPPDHHEHWGLETLEAIVQETLDLAKLRTIDNAALFGSNRHGHFLPALYFAFNPDSDPEISEGVDIVTTVSTDFSPVAENISEEVFPSLTSIMPDFGFIDEPVQISIRGDNLAEATTVRFLKPDGSSAVPASDVEVVSNAEIRCTVTPVGDTGHRDVEVVTEHHGAAASQNFNLGFDFRERALLTRINPTSQYNGETFTLSIIGENLAAATAVTFQSSGIHASNLRDRTGTSIKCTITISSSTSGGNKLFQVITPNGTVSGSLTVTERPTLTSISPSSLPLDRTNRILIIRGSNLTGATDVRFLNANGVGLKTGVGGSIVRVRSSTELECRISVGSGASVGDCQFDVLIPTGKNGRVINSSLRFRLTEPIGPIHL